MNTKFIKEWIESEFDRINERGDTTSRAGGMVAMASVVGAITYAEENAYVARLDAIDNARFEAVKKKVAA